MFPEIISFFSLTLMITSMLNLKKGKKGTLSRTTLPLRATIDVNTEKK
jgi:hypothetical protein